MNILVTGITGFVGSRLVPRLERDGHSVRGFSRRPPEASPNDAPTASPTTTILTGDAVTGEGLADALRDIDVAYFLIHSMEPVAGTASADGAAAAFGARERRAAENFARAASEAGVSRVIYLGGLVPAGGPASAHLASRLAVEEILLSATPCSVAFRASIVIGAESRSFRFLVRLRCRRGACTSPLRSTSAT
jgi:nucleoside-diphosphate-sugar epimerase